MAFKDNDLKEINLLLNTFINAYSMKEKFHWEGFFSDLENKKIKDELLKQFIKKLVVEIFKKLETIK